MLVEPAEAFFELRRSETKCRSYGARIVFIRPNYQYVAPNGATDKKSQLHRKIMRLDAHPLH